MPVLWYEANGGMPVLWYKANGGNVKIGASGKETERVNNHLVWYHSKIQSHNLKFKNRVELKFRKWKLTLNLLPTLLGGQQASKHPVRE